MRSHRAAAFLVVALLACGDPEKPAPAASSASAARPTAAASVASASAAALGASASASASASAPAAPLDPNAPFVRSPPSSHKASADAVDECTQSGGNYFSCSGAYEGEEDAVLKRYLYRIAQAQAAGVKDYGKAGPPQDMGGLPHAEVPAGCDPKKPCDIKDDGLVSNGLVNCLALAHAQYGSNPAAAKAAHAHACRCGGKGGAFIGYNSSAFICDKDGKPAFLAPDMKKDEAKDILDCAICEPKLGPAACKADADRLRKADAELAKYIEMTQVRRCQTADPEPATK
ncbi:MAG: hypothetical protein HOV80_16715 [Polyangiaceae bacterium]|nr:hypothetical protein [Polyangiaceae bacterium]